MRSTPWPPRRWICCSFCMRTTSRTPALDGAPGGSTGTNPYAAISRAFPALGPARWRRERGGAQHVGRHRLGRRISTTFPGRVKDKADSVRRWGSDIASTELRPRAKIYPRDVLRRGFEKMGVGVNNNPLFGLRSSSRRAHSRTSISCRASLSNVDFYSASLLGPWIPRSMLFYLVTHQRSLTRSSTLPGWGAAALTRRGAQAMPSRCAHDPCAGASAGRGQLIYVAPALPSVQYLSCGPSCRTESRAGRCPLPIQSKPWSRGAETLRSRPPAPWLSRDS